MAGQLRDRVAIRERLGFYALGVAIGLFMLGLLMYARGTMARKPPPPNAAPAPMPAAPASTR